MLCCYVICYVSFHVTLKNGTECFDIPWFIVWRTAFTRNVRILIDQSRQLLTFEFLEESTIPCYCAHVIKTFARHSTKIWHIFPMIIWGCCSECGEGRREGRDRGTPWPLSAHSNYIFFNIDSLISSKLAIYKVLSYRGTHWFGAFVHFKNLCSCFQWILF